MADRTFDITLDPALAYLIADLSREYAAEGDGLYPNDDEDLDNNEEDDPILEAERRTDDGSPESTDPVENELRDIIEGLNVDAQKDLLALIWLGRDDGTPEDWHRVRRQATETPHLHVAQYVEETPLASDYLRSGLANLGYEDDR